MSFDLLFRPAATTTTAAAAAGWLCFPSHLKANVFFHSTPHCKKMQIPTSSRGAPCGQKDISALSTPKGICVARHPYSNRAHRRRWSALKNLPRWKRWERYRLAVRPLLFGRSKRCRRGPLHFLFCHLLSEDKCTSLTLELRMGAKKSSFFYALGKSHAPQSTDKPMRLLDLYFT